MKCYLSNSEENLSKINVDDVDYYFDEEKYADLSIKAVKEAIRKRRDEAVSKTSVLAKAMQMEAEKYGISLSDLVKELTDGKIDIAKIGRSAAPVIETKPVTKPKIDEDDGFVAASGDLESNLKVSVNLVSNDKGSIAPTNATGYRAPVIDGQKIMENDKRTKRDGNTLVTRSSFGETRILIRPTNSKEFNESMTQTDDYDLVRKADRARECPLCRGSCIVQNKECPKCKGTGQIFV